MAEMVYKVCPAAAWADAVRKRSYLGSPDDLRDGFIHLSTATQLPGTLQRHFSDAEGRALAGLVLVSIPVSGFGASLAWEPARDGSLFPHLYGPLDPELAAGVTALVVGSDGRHELPGDLR